MRLDKLIAQGNTARIYLKDGKAVKVFERRFPEGEAVYEAEKQKLAFSYGLPVPRVLDVTSIDGRPAVVMEYIEGLSLGELMQRNPEQGEHYLKLSVLSQMEVHSKTVSGLETLHDRLTKHIQGTAALPAELRPKLLLRLQGLPEGDKLCHGDFHVYNLIQQSGRITVIDWICAAVGSPAADVYRSYLLYTHNSQELAECYLRLYCEKSGVSREDILQWAPVVAAARLAEDVPTENTKRLLEIVRAGLA